MTTLEPMDDATYEAWRRETERFYAEEKVRSGEWPEAEGLARSRAEFLMLLPEGRETPGHRINSMVDARGTRVGYAWFVVEERPIGRVVFIYDIAVDPEHQRKGHARAALELIAAYAREQGAMGVQLHVFGDNTGARELYRKAGFVETNVMMLRRVNGPS